MKNILAEAEISEKFDSEFAIYDLPEFLRTVELFQKPSLLILMVVQMYKSLITILNNQLNTFLLTSLLLWRLLKTSQCQIKKLLLH